MRRRRKNDPQKFSIRLFSNRYRVLVLNNIAYLPYFYACISNNFHYHLRIQRYFWLFDTEHCGVSTFMRAKNICTQIRERNTSQIIKLVCLIAPSVSVRSDPRQKVADNSPNFKIIKLCLVVKCIHDSRVRC